MIAAAPGRACGDCNACCAYYDLMRDFGKPQGVLCRHWQSGTGCSIHAVRPNICRDFHCFWLLNPALDEDWRPDRSGIIARETLENIPAHWPVKRGLVFEVCGPDSSVEREAFVIAVANHIFMGIPVFLACHGPMGFGSMYAFLNEVMADAARSGQVETMRAALAGTLRDLRAG